MTVTVTFEIQPQPTGRSQKRSPSNFPVDQATETKYYSVNYDFDPYLNSQDNDDKISSIYVREFVKSLPATSLRNNFPIESRFYDVFPLYIDWLKAKEPQIDSQSALTISLQLADWLDDESYINYVVQKIFDNWTNTMATPVYFEFYSQLQYLVLIRAPYFLLPKYSTNDKIFMNDWFKHNKDRVIWIDNKFEHRLNFPHTIRVDEQEFETLANYVIPTGGSRQPFISFYDNSHHIARKQQITGERAKLYLTGEVTIYFDDDKDTVYQHGYNDDISRLDGLWTTTSPGGTTVEQFYTHGVLTGPGKFYYASGQVSTYTREVDQPSSSLDGIYPGYNDDTKNTLNYELTIKEGVVVDIRYYEVDKLAVEIHYKGDLIDYANLYYDSGRVRTHITVTADNPEGVHDAVVEQLLTIYNVEVTNFYDNDRHNLESSGRLQHGNQVGVWRYYNDDAENTIRQLIRH